MKHMGNLSYNIHNQENYHIYKSVFQESKQLCLPIPSAVEGLLLKSSQSNQSTP